MYVISNALANIALNDVYRLRRTSRLLDTVRQFRSSVADGWLFTKTPVTSAFYLRVGDHRGNEREVRVDAYIGGTRLYHEYVRADGEGAYEALITRHLLFLWENRSDDPYGKNEGYDVLLTQNDVIQMCRGGELRREVSPDGVGTTYIGTEEHGTQAMVGRSPHNEGIVVGVAPYGPAYYILSSHVTDSVGKVLSKHSVRTTRDSISYGLDVLLCDRKDYTNWWADEAPPRYAPMSLDELCSLWERNH